MVEADVHKEEEEAVIYRQTRSGISVTVKHLAILVNAINRPQVSSS